MRSLYRQSLIWLVLAQAGGARAENIWPLLDEGCLPADGGQDVEVAVYLTASDSTGAKPEARTDLGNFGPARSAGAGLYYLPFQPPALDTTRRSGWKIMREGAGQKPAVELEVELCPFPAGRVQIQADPDRLIAGEGQQAVISLQVQDAYGRPEEKAQLDLTVNTGEIRNLRQIRPGLYQAVYLPPSDPFPQIAILMAVNAASTRFGRLAVGRVIIPITARVTLPGKTTPGTTMSVSVGGRTFGPITSDRHGKFELPVLIPPGVQRGLATSTDRAGNRSSRWVDFFLPPTNQLGLWVYPRQLAADGRASARLLITTMEANGQPLDTKEIKLQTDAGVIEDARRVAPGLLEARYTAPRLPAGGRATINVSFLSGGPRSRAEAQVELLAAPARDFYASFPASLPADGRSRRPLQVKVVGAENQPVGGKLLRIKGERLDSTQPVEISPGVFESQLTAPARPELWQSRLEIDVQENPGETPHRIIVPQEALSRRQEQYLLECFLLDQSNRPVAGREIVFSLGDRAQRAITDAFGRAEFVFSPPADTAVPRPAVFALSGAAIRQTVFLAGAGRNLNLLPYQLSPDQPLSRPLRKEFSIQLYPPPAIEIRLESRPQDGKYLIEATLLRPDGRSPEGVEVRFSSSAGEIFTLDRPAPGRVRALLDPGPPGWRKIFVTASPASEASAAFVEIQEAGTPP